MVAFLGPLFDVAECVAPALSTQGGLEHCQQRLRKFLCFSNKGKAQLQIRPHRSCRELQPAQVIPSAPARARQRASAQPYAVDGARTKPDERGAGRTRLGFVQIRPHHLYRVGPPARKQDLGRASLFLSSRGARGPGRALFLGASRAADGARAADSLKISCAYGACAVSSTPSGPRARSWWYS